MHLARNWIPSYLVLIGGGLFVDLSLAVGHCSVFLSVDAVAEIPAAKMTVGQLTAHLSTGSGLTIEAAPSIRNRVITLSVQQQSVRSVLDALAEIYGWQWRETSPDHILLARKQALPAHNIHEMMIGISRALPPDIKQLISPAKQPVYPGSSTGRQDPFLAGERVARERQALVQKLTDLEQTTPRKLWDSVLAHGRAGEKVTFEKLTVDERELLILSMLMRALSSSLQLLRNEFVSYQLNPLASTIRYDPGSNLMSIIGSDGSRMTTAVKP